MIPDELLKTYYELSQANPISSIIARKFNEARRPSDEGLPSVRLLTCGLWALNDVAEV